MFFNGRLLGLSQEEIENRFDEIAGFADIGDFIEQPVKTYSSGMFVRLAFAVAVNVDPEVLIVDEALAVGDVVFQHRCMRRMRALMDSGVTTLFVSHDSGAIKTLCNSAVMIHDGEIYTKGLPNAVTIEYLKLVTDLELGLVPANLESNFSDTANEVINSNQEQFSGVLPNNSQVTIIDKNSEKASRRGSGKARIDSIKLLNSFGEDIGENTIFAFNEEIILSVKLKTYEYLESCIVGFFICDKNGNEIIGSNTFEENIKIDRLQPNEELEVDFKFKLPLRPNSYSVTVAGAENYEALTFDWIDNAVVFQVLPPSTGKNIHALVAQTIIVTVNKQIYPTPV